MTWQKCPVCEGTGNNGMIGYEFATCKVCNGQKIISELTGLPPQKPNK